MSPQQAQQDDHPVAPEFYANSCAFTVTIYEFLLQFGIKTDPKTDAKALVNVRMSPQHAKVMARILAKNVKAYEKEVGPIYLPPQLIQELRLDDEEKL